MNYFPKADMPIEHTELSDNNSDKLDRQKNRATTIGLIASVATFVGVGWIAESKITVSEPLSPKEIAANVKQAHERYYTAGDAQQRFEHRFLKTKEVKVRKFSEAQNPLDPLVSTDNTQSLVVKLGSDCLRLSDYDTTAGNAEVNFNPQEPDYMEIVSKKNIEHTHLSFEGVSSGDFRPTNNVTYQVLTYAQQCRVELPQYDTVPNDSFVQENDPIIKA